MSEISRDFDSTIYVVVVFDGCDDPHDAARRLPQRVETRRPTHDPHDHHLIHLLPAGTHLHYQGESALLYSF